jgi:hypothetical protein
MTDEDVTSMLRRWDDFYEGQRRENFLLGIAYGVVFGAAVIYFLVKS